MIDSDTEYFMYVYLRIKRQTLKMPYLKMFKEGSKPFNDLLKVAEVVKELKTTPEDYIMFQIKRLAPLRIFPVPSMLLSEKSINKYKVHQAMKGIYNNKYYIQRGNSIVIKSTGENYELTDFYTPMGKDPKAIYIDYMLSNPHILDNLEDKPRTLNDIEYLFAKYEFLDKKIPDNLLELKEKINEI